MSSSVDQIKSKLDIVTVISAYIKLDKAGMNFKGRCPFHNEKTPSFFVSPDRGGYYCFGCHQKGDIFSFVQEFEGLDFVGALKVLAEKAGVELDQHSRGEKSEKDVLHAVMEQAVFFYQKQLSENVSAKEYLKGRGISDETIKDFRLGFVPAEWRGLYEYLLERKVSVKDMLVVGLIKQKEGTDSYYDTFRGRVMFPIADSSGRVVGFSGRILVADDKSPKYLNSPETVLFNKSEILFGLDKAKKDIRLKDYSVLVEGQMDLVSLHQAGITNTVASSGTALTAEHLVKLRRLSNNLMMFFDGDNAGFAASNRSAKIALSLGMELKLVQIPDGKDPADLAKESMDLLRDCLRNAKNIVDFYVDTLLAKKLEPRELSIEVRKNVLPYVSELPHKTDRDDAIKAIVRKTFISEEALKDDLAKIRSNVSVEPTTHGASPPNSRLDSIERKVFGIVLWQRQSQKKGEIIKINVEEKVGKIFGIKFAELEKKFENDPGLLFETEQYYNSTDIEKDISELLVSLELEYVQREFDEAKLLLQKAEQARDSGEVLKYLEECGRISRRIQDLKNQRLEK